MDSRKKKEQAKAQKAVTSAALEVRWACILRLRDENPRSDRKVKPSAPEAFPEAGAGTSGAGSREAVPEAAASPPKMKTMQAPAFGCPPLLLFFQSRRKGEDSGTARMHDPRLTWTSSVVKPSEGGLAQGCTQVAPCDALRQLFCCACRGPRLGHQQQQQRWWRRQWVCGKIRPLKCIVLPARGLRPAQHRTCCRATDSGCS